MSRDAKLKAKLLRGSQIKHSEAQSLLSMLGFKLARQRGSHEQWVRAGQAFTLAAHGKDAPHYILDALRKLFIEEDNDEK